MPFNGSGTFNRLYSWAVDAANNVNISSSRTDAELNGIAAALTNCLTRDGQSPPSADLPMGGKKLTNLGAAAAGTDALNRDTADARYLASGSTSGTGAVVLANSPALTGVPTAPTAAPGTNTTQLATMAAIQAAIAALINAAPGALDTLKELADALGDDPNYATTITGLLAAKAPLASPALTGTPTAPTAAAGTSTTQVASTAFVQATTRPAFPGNVSASFSAADADNNTHKVASGAAQTLTLGSLTAGTAFTIRFTTAWSIACAGGLSKNGAAPGGVTTGSIAANSLITFLHEGAGVWDASGQGLS